jgi:hypothetical protein
MKMSQVKRFLVVFACAALFIGLGVSDGSARGGGRSGGSSGGSSTGSHHVQGYSRKDGTDVPAYNRRGPGEGGQSRSGSIHLERGAASAHYTTSAPGARDNHGRLMRSEAAKSEFMGETGYAHGRPGYVVDHIVPLKRGGCDCPANMQWQTVAEAKAKDKWE